MKNRTGLLFFWRGMDKQGKHFSLALTVLTVLFTFAGGIAWAAVVISTSISTSSITKAGGQTGPWTISASGTASLSKTEKACNGFKFTVANDVPTTYTGYVSLPKGDPTLGGDPVTWNDSTDQLRVQGTYSAVCTMSYTDGNNMPQKISTSRDVTLP